MVFNIYGERTYNDAEIYNGIRNNTELNNFFTSFTEYYNRKSESIKSEEMEKLEKKSPNLDELKDIISKIKKTGITISGEQWLFFSITENTWKSVNIGLPFRLIIFNNVFLLEEEFEYFQTQDAGSTKVLSKLERTYKQWKKDNKK